MKFKRVCAFCASVLMLAGSALPASAGNVKDTEWNFNLSYNQTSYVTDKREKTNDSSTYVYYKNGTPSSLSCIVLNSENQPMWHKNGPAVRGEPGLLYQTVYEQGYRFAKLKLSSSETYGGAGGVWSPDSVGDLYILNK